MQIVKFSSCNKYIPDRITNSSYINIYIQYLCVIPNPIKLAIVF